MRQGKSFVAFLRDYLFLVFDCSNLLFYTPSQTLYFVLCHIDSATVKAADAAISARQWTKAVQILQVIRDNPKSEVYYKKIADHYANIGEYENAER